MAARRRTLKHDETVRPIAKVISAAFSSTDFNVLVLRCHMIFETLLFRLLAVRLNVEVPDLPMLSFGPLVAIALAGDRFEDVRDPIDALTRIRNQIAHDVEYGNIEQDIASYVEAHRRFAARAKAGGDDLPLPVLLTFQRIIRGVGTELLGAMRSRRELDVIEAKNIILEWNLDSLRFNADLFRDEVLPMDEQGHVGLTTEQAEALRKWTMDIATNLSSA